MFIRFILFLFLLISNANALEVVNGITRVYLVQQLLNQIALNIILK